MRAIESDANDFAMVGGRSLEGKVGLNPLLALSRTLVSPTSIYIHWFSHRRFPPGHATHRIPPSVSSWTKIEVCTEAMTQACVRSFKSLS